LSNLELLDVVLIRHCEVRIWGIQLTASKSHCALSCVQYLVEVADIAVQHARGVIRWNDRRLELTGPLVCTHKLGDLRVGGEYRLRTLCPHSKDRTRSNSPHFSN